MMKEDYQTWMTIDNDIPVAAKLTEIEICKGILNNDDDRRKIRKVNFLKDYLQMQK